MSIRSFMAAVAAVLAAVLFVHLGQPSVELQESEVWRPLDLPLRGDYVVVRDVSSPLLTVANRSSYSVEVPAGSDKVRVEASFAGLHFINATIIISVDGEKIKELRIIQRASLAEDTVFKTISFDLNVTGAKQIVFGFETLKTIWVHIYTKFEKHSPSEGPCAVLECRYYGGQLEYRIPSYTVKVFYQPLAGYAALTVFIILLAVLVHMASTIENMSTKKALAVMAMVYGSGLTLLMLTRKDFRYAAPLLAPLAAALLLAGILLYLLLRAAGKPVRLEVRR
ncbi:MAG: hypothetical protein QXD61_11805 [Candidatus Caldarchaeum sp.]